MFAKSMPLTWEDATIIRERWTRHPSLLSVAHDKTDARIMAGMTEANEPITSDLTISVLGPKCPACAHVIEPTEPHYYNNELNEETCPRCLSPFHWLYHRSRRWTARPVK